MMNFSFHPEAEEEAEKSTLYYTEIAPEYGEHFQTEIGAAIDRIIQAPNAWKPLKKDVRRCPLNRFPFGLIYRVNEGQNEIQIFAVMHVKRKPGYWENRRF